VYYKCHKTKTTQWQKPSLEDESLAKRPRVNEAPSLKQVTGWPVSAGACPGLIRFAMPAG